MFEEIFDAKRGRNLLEMFLSPTDELKDGERWKSGEFGKIPENFNFFILFLDSHTIEVPRQSYRKCRRQLKLNRKRLSLQKCHCRRRLSTWMMTTMRRRRSLRMTSLMTNNCPQICQWDRHRPRLAPSGWCKREEWGEFCTKKFRTEFKTFWNNNSVY